MLDAAFSGHIWVLGGQRRAEKTPAVWIKNKTKKKCMWHKKGVYNTSIRHLPHKWMLLPCLVVVGFFFSQGEQILPLWIACALYCERGGWREGGGGEGLIQNSWKKGRGRWEEKGGRGGPNMTCVSVYWNVCGALLSVQTGWETREERRSASALRPSLKLQRPHRESRRCAQEGWEIGRDQVLSLSAWIHSLKTSFFNFHFRERVFVLFGYYQCLER